MIRSKVSGFLNLIFLSVMVAPTFAEPPALSFDQGEPDPAMNALFEQKEGWIGGDGGNSVIIGGRRVWLFSDTWIGKIRDGKRVDATIVNNTLGLQKASREASEIRFVVQKNTDEKATAFWTPADGQGWFWLQAGVYSNKNLSVFLSQIEKTVDNDVFGFRQTGQTLGVVSNPDDEPTSWRMEQRKLPFTIFSPTRELTFGASILQVNDDLYVFGSDEDIKPDSRDRYLIVARVPSAQLEDFSAWRFFDGKGWNKDYRAVSRVVGEMATECSVSYLPAMKQYVLVYTERGLSDRILVRTASNPIGPWSDSKIVYRCPEAGWNKKIFCYGAKAHPSLAIDNELVICYFANSFDFWQVAADARIYLPRFIRVKVREDK